MLHIMRCPVCRHKGIRVETNTGFKPVASGRKISEYPMKTYCTVCRREIKYDVVKDDGIIKIED